MERRAQFLNKLLLFVWAAVIGVTFYSSTRIKNIPNIWVATTHPDLIYTNGLLYYKQEVFSGWLFENYSNSNRAKEIPYFEGKIEGSMRSWYKNKTAEQIRTYNSGKKEGIHRGWWPNGNLKFEYTFVDDEHEGLAKEWFDNKQLYRVFTYKAGHEDGQQRMWWDDGSIRANYVVKNGRQYGLIGRKLCKNVYKK